MLNLIADGMQAYAQVGFFIAALTCLAIGAFLIGYSIYRRRQAIQVSGTVIGVTASDSMFRPVYRYTLPDGRSFVAKSEMNSSWVRGKETGRVVPLMVSPENPAEAQEAGSWVLDVIGVVFIVPGIVFGYVALTYPFTLMTWVMVAALAIFLAVRGHRV